MAKVILEIGYKKYVINVEIAAMLLPLFADTALECYDTKWENGTTTPRVFPADTTAVGIAFLSDKDYALGKMLYAADEQAKQQGAAK